MGIGKRRGGVKYVEVKDGEVMGDDGIDDDNLYMALEGDLAGVQVGGAGDGGWDDSTEEEAELEEERGSREEEEHVEAAREENGEWLKRARLVAQAGVRKVVGVAKFGSRRAEQRSLRHSVGVRQVVHAGVVSAREERRIGAVGSVSGVSPCTWKWA